MLIFNIYRKWSILPLSLTRQFLRNDNAKNGRYTRPFQRSVLLDKQQEMMTRMHWMRWYLWINNLHKTDVRRTFEELERLSGSANALEKRSFNLISKIKFWKSPWLFSSKSYRTPFYNSNRLWCAISCPPPFHWAASVWKSSVDPTGFSKAACTNIFTLGQMTAILHDKAYYNLVQLFKLDMVH